MHHIFLIVSMIYSGTVYKTSRRPRERFRFQRIAFSWNEFNSKTSAQCIHPATIEKEFILVTGYVKAKITRLFINDTTSLQDSLNLACFTRHCSYGIKLRVYTSKQGFPKASSFLCLHAHIFCIWKIYPMAFHMLRAETEECYHTLKEQEQHCFFFFLHFASASG